MTTDPFLRYSRQVFIEEIGVEGQRRLNAAQVLVVGAGGLGSPVIQYLAAAGIGRLAVVDADVVEIHNLNRQVIHTEAFIGQPKVESAAAYVRSFNSMIGFSPIHQKLTAENVRDLIAPYDVIVDGSDNFTTRYIVNDACATQHKPLVYGSIFAMEGQVAVFNHRGGKQLRDLFPEPPDAAGVPDCDRFGVLGALPGIVGSIMALQVIQLVTGLQPLHNQLLLIDTKNWEFRKINF